MKYVVLILITSFLLKPCFAQKEGYNDYSSNAVYELQAEGVPVDINGFVVISKSNNLYALPARVEDNQVVLQENQIKFVVDSMQLNPKILSDEIVPYPVEKQGTAIDSAYYDSPEFLSWAGVFAKAYISKTGIPEDWNGVHQIAAVDPFSDKVKADLAVDNEVQIGPNGGGGAYDQVNFYKDYYPYDRHWQVVGNAELINNIWGRGQEVSGDWLEVVREVRTLQAKQQYNAFISDAVSRGFNDFINDEVSKGFNAVMDYNNNADLMTENSQGLFFGKKVWLGDRFSETEIIYQPEEEGQRAIDVLHGFSDQIRAYPYTDDSLYIVGPNGGGGAYYIIQAKYPKTLPQ